MGGGKETPRQKMVGLMYLVLMALLAMNVSKEIINAFVTLNNKIEKSIKQTEDYNRNINEVFDVSIATLKSTGAAPKAVYAADGRCWCTRLLSHRHTSSCSPKRKTSCKARNLSLQCARRSAYPT